MFHTIIIPREKYIPLERKDLGNLTDLDYIPDDLRSVYIDLNERKISKLEKKKEEKKERKELLNSAKILSSLKKSSKKSNSMRFKELSKNARAKTKKIKIRKNKTRKRKRKS